MAIVMPVAPGNRWHRLRMVRRMCIEVTDSGPGFDPAVVRPEGLGLAGLSERVESLGGRFGIKSSETGTKVWMALNTYEMERA